MTFLRKSAPSAPASSEPELEPPTPTSTLVAGQMVLTPTGSQAELVAIYPDVDEGLVQWSSGDRARFKLGLLRPIPKQE